MADPTKRRQFDKRPDPSRYLISRDLAFRWSHQLEMCQKTVFDKGKKQCTKKCVPKKLISVFISSFLYLHIYKWRKQLMVWKSWITNIPFMFFFSEKIGDFLGSYSYTSIVHTNAMHIMLKSNLKKHHSRYICSQNV